MSNRYLFRSKDVWVRLSEYDPDSLRLQNDPFGVIAGINGEELIGERDEF